MIDSYKNIERLRYRINLDLKEIKEEVENDSLSWIHNIVTEFFSAIIASLISCVLTSSSVPLINSKFLPALNDSEDNSLLGDVLFIVFIILLYIIFTFVIYCILNKTIKRRIRTQQKKEKNKKNLQKEFDNIACDSIVAAYEYIELIKNNKGNVLGTFYFFEVIHYVEQTVNILVKLSKFNDTYLKTDNKATGIEIYRLNNVKDIIKKILDDLNLYIGDSTCDSDDKKIVEKKINNILKDYENIDIWLNNYVNYLT